MATLAAFIHAATPKLLSFGSIVRQEKEVVVEIRDTIASKPAPAIRRRSLFYMKGF
jgi:hypothetical protein